MKLVLRTSALDRRIKLLTQHGLVYEMLCASLHVFCHDKNRFGQGLVPDLIVVLFVAIMAVGFSFEEANPKVGSPELHGN